MIKRRSTLLSNQFAGQHAGRRILSVTNKMRRKKQSGELKIIFSWFVTRIDYCVKILNERPV